MSDIVNVEEIVKSWVWDDWEIAKKHLPAEKKKIPTKNLDLDINWSKVKFNYGDPVYKDSIRSHLPKSQVLFKTYFINNTEQDQEYSFKTERTSKSVCTVDITKGVTKGFEANVTLKTPGEVFEASAGFKRELTIDTVEGKTIEESLTWAVDSQIKVPSKRKTVAELVITEDEYKGEFVTKGTIQGSIIVTITNTKDNNSIVDSQHGDIVEVFRPQIEDGKLKGFSIKKNCIHFETSGKCYFRFGVEQRVKLNQFLIEKDEE